MKKEVVSSLLVAGLVSGLSAGGDLGGVVSFENEVAPVEVVVPYEEPVKEVKVVKAEPKVEPKVEPKPKVEVEEKKSNSNFYIVAKGLSILGDEADSGYGVGLDLGYRIGNGLAVELSATTSKNDLDIGGDDSYKTGALNLVYTIPVSDSIGIFAKGGYMIEDRDNDDDKGFAYGGGLSYSMSDATAVVAEYQGSNIDSTRGDAVSLGLMYNF
jgi:opacity protein-like surface antigen